MSLKFVVLFLIGITITSTNGHSLSKRQNFILTLNVNSHQGVEPTQAQQTEAITDHHFPVDSPVLTITCTMTNPSHFYRLSITKEQKFNNNETAPVVQYLSSGVYALAPNLDSDKYTIQAFEPSPNVIKVVLTIKNLKLQDNEPPQLNHILFPTPSVEKLNLNTMVSLNCRVNDVYPKPKVFFTHPSQNLTELTTEKDISSTKHDDFYPYSILSTVNFTVDYKDHNKYINCTVQATGSHEIQLSKPYQLKVTGTQFIDQNCADSLLAKINDEDFEIKCTFFSNPRTNIEWHIEQTHKKTTVTDSNELNNNNDVGEQSESENSDLVLKVEDDNENYKVMIEDVQNGVYIATLKFNNKIKDDDFKNYTLKIGSISRSFRVVRSESELSKSLTSDNQDSSKAFKFHSNTSFLLMNIIFFFIYLSR
ncbi:unnamed protein product [Brachionus calyciflorus]|uniref:Immunoglobulin C1-set domain-containing protein n=1 Tax=Brachionus calyciflorus TaxID=104777 RepID=A0A814CHD1_9BILA|nr:unnamed protein product [Brachionus calyciflorus]